MSAQNLAKHLGIETSAVEGLVEEIDENKELKDSTCEAIGSLNPDSFGASFITNDFRALARAKPAGKAGAFAGILLKGAGVTLGVLGARAGYIRWVQ